MSSLPSTLDIPAGWYAVARRPRPGAGPEQVAALGTVLTVSAPGGAAFVADDAGRNLSVAEAFGLVFVHAGDDPAPGTAVLDRICAAWPPTDPRPGSVYDVDVPWDVPVSDFVNPQHTEPVHLTRSEPWRAVPEPTSSSSRGRAPRRTSTSYRGAAGASGCTPRRATTCSARARRCSASRLRDSASPTGSPSSPLLSTRTGVGCSSPTTRSLGSDCFVISFPRRCSPSSPDGSSREVARDLEHWRLMGRPGYTFGPLVHDSDLLRDWLHRPAAGRARTLGQPAMAGATQSA